jgi:DNA-binding transcriptional LysR family regulator
VRSWAVFDWNDLRYLAAIAEAKTLVGAARELGVKHTTVARRLAALESDLGAQLLHKGRDGYTLTATGVELAAFAAELKAKADAIERRVGGSDARVAGVVRVTMPDSVAAYFVQQLPALRERHPDLVVNILADLRVYDLLAGEADVAVRIHPRSEGNLIARKLGVAAWSLYASRSYVAKRGAPRTPAELVGHDLIGFEGAALEASPGGVWFREHMPEATYVMRGNGILQIFNAALMGFGVTMLPCLLADAEPMLERLTPVTFSNRPIRMLVAPEAARLARVRAVMDFIVEVFTRDAGLFGGQGMARGP